MRRLLCCVALVVAPALALPALADSQDFQIYRLGDPTQDATAHERFRVFANQLGVALSSFNLSPPETLGHSAFNFAFEYAAVKVDASEGAWPRAGKPPTDMLLLPTVHMRKGLPFSFELGTKISYLQFSRMAAATVEVKWALNEGFFYFPDLGVRGHATRLLGTRDFGLTTAGLDIGLGKQFALGGMLTLTPYAGWNLVYVNASSGVVDFRPDRSLADAQTRPTEFTGVFDQVSMPQNHSNRFYGGLRFVSYVFELGAEVSYTKTFGDKKVLGFAGKLGLDF